jgi:hypothetical protein
VEVSNPVYNVHALSAQINNLPDTAKAVDGMTKQFIYDFCYACHVIVHYDGQ